MVSVDDNELLSSLVADVAATADVLVAVPDAPVVHCPGWAVSDLVRHHAKVLRWAEAIVRSGEVVLGEFPAPTECDDLRDWHVDAADCFVSTASGLDRERRCWTFGRPPEQTWFWTRRQALEAAVHRWDAERATGTTPEIASELALVGVTEVVEDLFPRQVALERVSDLSCAVQLRATDADQRWVLTPARTGAIDATIEAPVAELFLLLWGRTDLDDPRIHFIGPRAIEDEMRAARFAP